MARFRWFLAAASVLLLLLLPSCRDESSPWIQSITPDGWIVYRRYPTLDLGEFDAAIIRARASITDPALDAHLGVMRFYLHPEPYPTDDSPTGWAAGTAYLEYHVIELARRVGDNPLLYPALEHEFQHFLEGPFAGH